MKNGLFNLALILIVVALIVFGIVNTLGGIENIAKLGGGSVFVGFLKAPFCIIGAVQLLRGLYSVIGKDLESVVKDTRSDLGRTIIWGLYLLVTIAGCLWAIEAYCIIK